MVGVASGAKEAPYPAFLESLPPFYAELSKKYEVELKWVVGQQLDAAQNEIAQYAIDNDFTHILMLEDDHWGHTIDMVETLFEGLDETHPVVASIYHSRHYPHLLTAMNLQRGKQKKTEEGEWTDFYMEVKLADGGFKEADLVSFGMMLIDVNLFSSLDKPYFYLSGDTQTTDINFCNSLQDVGFKPLVCTDYILPHRHLTAKTAMKEREKLASDRVVFRLWKSQQRLLMNRMTGIKRIKKFQAIAKKGNADCKDQLQLMEDLVVSTRALSIVEIGTRKGVSTSAFMAGMFRSEKLGRVTPHMITIDILDLPIHWWANEYESYITRIKGDSRTINIPKEIKLFGIDILFIDSSHLAEQTKIELERWGEHVNDGGLILLHDNVVCEKGVEVPARDYAAKHGYDYITDTRQCGMGIMFVNKGLKDLKLLKKLEEVNVNQ